jgi:hypothetical protein
VDCSYRERDAPRPVEHDADSKQDPSSLGCGLGCVKTVRPRETGDAKLNLACCHNCELESTWRARSAVSDLVAPKRTMRTPRLDRRDEGLHARPISVAYCWHVILAEIGNRLVIRNQPAGEPHHLNVAAHLTLKPAARLNPIEITRKWRASTAPTDDTKAGRWPRDQPRKTEARPDRAPRTVSTSAPSW